jgi:hypothetical protein
MIRVFACLLVCLISASGCSVAQKNIFEAQKNIFDQTKLQSMYTNMVDNYPKLNEMAEVYLGDRMLVERTGQYMECVTPNFDFQDDIMGTCAYVHAGEPICKQSSGPVNFKPFYNNISWNSGKSELSSPVILTRNPNGTIKLCVTNGGANIGCEDGINEADLNYGPTFVSVENSFQRVIEYAGRSGDILKFTYSEFKDDMAREAFNREFQIDISEGNIAAYKGAFIEIHKATNTSIKYSIKKYFGS